MASSMHRKLHCLVACECSQRVCKALRALGHDAYSCDIQPCYAPTPTELAQPEWHLQGDCLTYLDGHNGRPWDLLIAHPPCTYTSTIGNRYLYHPDDKGLAPALKRPHPAHPHRRAKQAAGVAFAKALYDCDIPHVCIEHPKSVLSTQWQHPDQWVQPHWFGHNWRKQTGLWLKNLPLLKPTDVVQPETYKDKKGRPQNVWQKKTSGLSPSQSKRKRSETSIGVADAMATQFTEYILGTSAISSKPGSPEVSYEDGGRTIIIKINIRA